MEREQQPTPEELAQQIEHTIATLSPHMADMRKLAQEIRDGNVSPDESEQAVSRTIEQLSRIC